MDVICLSATRSAGDLPPPSVKRVRSPGVHTVSFTSLSARGRARGEEKKRGLAPFSALPQHLSLTHNHEKKATFCASCTFHGRYIHSLKKKGAPRTVHSFFHFHTNKQTNLTRDIATVSLKIQQSGNNFLFFQRSSFSFNIR